MQPTQKTSTVSSGVLDMHLQGAGGSSQETHAGNPTDISTVSSGVLHMHLQGAGGSSQPNRHIYWSSGVITCIFRELVVAA